MRTNKIILLSLCLVLSFRIYTQNVSTQTTQKDSIAKLTACNNHVDSLLYKIDSLVQLTNLWLEQIELNHSLKYRYKLYQTENIYTLLELDTKTGQIEQIQWSLDKGKEGSFTINWEDLTFGDGLGSNSFELYPTKNMYQFILLNKTNGKKWHVQWGFGSGERWIRRIY